MRSRLAVLATMLAMAALSGCSDSGPSIDRVENAWVRAADSSATTAGYFTFYNNAKGPYSIVAATGLLCDDIQLHETVHDGALTSMREITRLVVPAGGKVEFKPGGNHAMLIGLRQRLEPGRTVRFTLLLENGGTIEIEAEVRE